MTGPLLSIIGILLAAASATMMTYHGGDALNRGLTKAEAASAIIAVTQVADAVQLHDLQEGTPYSGPDLSGLVQSEYLRSVPPNPTGGGVATLVVEGGQRLVVMPLGGSRTTCADVTGLIDHAKAGGTQRAGCAEIGGTPQVFARI